MNLGEKIYSLRTSKNLSQGDLADMLGVSRQSISKWENNSALPDLEKIIKLSEIFEISIDELVKGQAKTEQNAEAKVEYIYVQQTKPPLSGSKIVGIVMFGLAAMLFAGILFATGSVGGLFYAIPFVILGIICFVVRENAGLWCSWAAYIMGDVFLRFATGLSPVMILHTLHWSYEMNYGRLMISWVWFFILVALIICTIKCCKDKPIADVKKYKKLLVIGWILYTAEKVLIRILAVTGLYNTMAESIGYRTFALINNIAGLIKTLVLALLISQTVRYFKNRKQ